MPYLKVKYLHLCDYFLISQEGKASIIGDFDTVFSTEDKAVLNRAFLVAKMEGIAKTAHAIKIKLISQKKKSIFETNLDLTTNEKGIISLQFELLNMVFEEFGIHQFQILEKDEVIGEFDLTVARVHKTTPAKA